MQEPAFSAIGRMMLEDEQVVNTSQGLTVHIKSYPISEEVQESEVLIQQEDSAKQYLTHYFNPLHIINLTNEQYQYNNLIYLFKN